MRPSLYVHVPFCRQRCTYCNYPIRVARGGPDFLDALARELEIRSEALGEGPLPALYLGGGTPSALSRELLARLLELLAPWRDAESEFSIELNPEDLDEDLLDLLAAAGVNRLSLGLQSLHPIELKRSARGHGPGQARRALELLAASGLKWSADLIIGLPQQSDESFEASLEEVLRHGPDHLSLYTLELDPGVPLVEVFRRRPEWDPGEELRARLYLRAHERLEAAGFEHYEVSNYARPGRRCRYNESVWGRGEYLGLGPSAASHQGGRRWSNEPDSRRWAADLLDGRAPGIRADLRDPSALRLERLLLALRTREGLALSDPLLEGSEELLEAFEERGWSTSRQGRFRLLAPGWLRLDGILARLTT